MGHYDVMAQTCPSRVVLHRRLRRASARDGDGLRHGRGHGQRQDCRDGRAEGAGREDGQQVQRPIQRWRGARSASLIVNPGHHEESKQSEIITRVYLSCLKIATRVYQSAQYSSSFEYSWLLEYLLSVRQ